MILFDVFFWILGHIHIADVFFCVLFLLDDMAIWHCFIWFVKSCWNRWNLWWLMYQHDIWCRNHWVWSWNPSSCNQLWARCGQVCKSNRYVCRSPMKQRWQKLWRCASSQFCRKCLSRDLGKRWKSWKTMQQSDILPISPANKKQQNQQQAGPQGR